MKYLLYALLLGIPIQASNKKQPTDRPTRAKFTITNHHAGGTSTSKTYKTHFLKNGLGGVMLLAIAGWAWHDLEISVRKHPELALDMTFPIILTGPPFNALVRQSAHRLAIAGCALFGLNRLWNIYEVRHRSLTTRRGTDTLRAEQSQAQEVS